MAGEEQAIHRTAAEGFSSAAESYSRGRPGYPPEVGSWLRNRIALRPGATAVDLGAGTGKFTPYLLETGATVIAVEPVGAMRAQLSAALPQVETRAGAAEAIPLPDASVDAVVCAQAFHWFATPQALTEIHRVLKSGGRLGLIWNLRDEQVGWVARLNQIVNRIEGDTPRYHSGIWRRLFPFPGFSPLHEERFAHSHTGPPEHVVLDRVRSTSYVAALPPEERASVEEQVRELIAAEFHGEDVVAFPYETAAFDAVKTA